MKKFTLTSIACLLSACAFAQTLSDGYYRVLNNSTSRYITIIDNYGKINYQANDADLGAIQTVRGFDYVESDPGSIIFIDVVSASGNNMKCDFSAQGVKTSKFLDGGCLDVQYVNRGENIGTYMVGASKAGITLYLSDSRLGIDDNASDILSSVTTKDSQNKYWKVLPVNQDANQYFGMKPEFNIGSDWYMSFYAAFPFSFQSSGMEAYIVNRIDNTDGTCNLTKMEGDVPASTPVFVKCASSVPADNRLDIHQSSLTAPTGNYLRGVYFDRTVPIDPGNPHEDYVVNDTAHMRVLGVCSDGKLGFVKSTLAHIPANRAYLAVGVGSPAEFAIINNPVTSLKLNATTLELMTGESATLTATIAPADADRQTLRWYSSDPSVVKVEDGVVTALAEGFATVTAETTDGTHRKAHCAITSVSAIQKVTVDEPQTTSRSQMYDTAGKSVDAPHKGAIIIKDGKKYLVR